MKMRRCHKRFFRESGIFCVITCFAVFVPTGCSILDQSDDRSAKQVGSVNADVTNGDDLVKKEADEFDEKYVKERIQRISSKLGLYPLADTSNQERFEFRLWINLDMTHDEKLFVIRSNGNDNRGTFYHIRVANEPFSFDKEPLAKPKSGWKPLRSEVSDQLDTPNRLAPDPEPPLIRDEGSIALEFLEKGEYQFVFYGSRTDYYDGVRLIKLCEYLSGEFGVNMDCRQERTRRRPIS